MKSGMTLFKVLFMLNLVTFANFPPHSLTLLEVTVTGDQMKRTVILNKHCWKHEVWLFLDISIFTYINWYKLLI